MLTWYYFEMPEEGNPQNFNESPVEQDHEKEKIERLRRAMYSRALEPNIKEKPRRELEETLPPIGEEWKQSAETASSGIAAAPRRLHLVRVMIRYGVYAGAAFAIGAAGFVGYYFFLGGGSDPSSPGNIDITVSGPLQVQSGSPTELQIAIVNRNRVALEGAELLITFPQGTRSVNDLATPLPELRQPLGDIEPGGRRQGTISVVFAGREGERAGIKIELEYRLQGSSALFVAESGYQIIFSSSPVSISVESNTETISGQPIEFRINVASNAEAPVRNVLLSMNTPFGFTLESADPKRSSQTSTGSLWELGDLNPGQRKEVLVRGTMRGESGDERVFRFISGTSAELEGKSIDTTLADYSRHVTVSNPFLGLTVVTSKEGGENNAIAGPGETVNVAVQYQNNLSTPINDAVIVAQLSGLQIDGASVKSSDGFYRSSDRVVLWDKSTTNGGLATIAPGARGSVSFSFLMPSNDVLKSLRDPKLTISVRAAGRRIGEENVPETLQSTASQTIRVASDLQLVAQGLYYTNPLGSSGPMPPRAGEETVYGAIVSITNTTNRITNAIVRGSLPPYVRWTGIYAPASADFSFNQNDGTFTWRVGTVEAGTGTDAPVRQLGFNIGFEPSTSQIGQQPSLVRNVTLTGTDEATGQAVTLESDDITTNIFGDSGFNPANATVVK